MRRVFIVTASLAALTVLLIAYAARVNQAAWEVQLVRWLQAHQPAVLQDAWVGLAVIGHGTPWIWLVAICAAALGLFGGLRLALLVGVAAAIKEAGAVLKDMVERPRPSATVVEVSGQFPSSSFPSGHTLGATLVFGFVGLALGYCALPAGLTTALRVTCIGWVCLMGLSRVQLGAHWPTDVLGGYLVGLLLLLPMAVLLRRGAPRRIEGADEISIPHVRGVIDTHRPLGHRAPACAAAVAEPERTIWRMHACTRRTPGRMTAAIRRSCRSRR